MSEFLFVHLLWSFVTLSALYMVFSSIQKYAAVKSIESFAIATERLCGVMLTVLKSPELSGKDRYLRSYRHEYSGGARGEATESGGHRTRSFLSKSGCDNCGRARV
jgi:hypothetical protein